MYDLITDMDKGTFRRKGNTYIYDKDNRKIGKIGNEKYVYKESSKISDYIKNGYIAQEDRRFASHHGIDLRGIARASLVMIKNKGHATQGASTITQQVVKNNLLSSERTMQRKITEIMIALQLEKTYSKAQIMEFYCNSIIMGVAAMVLKAQLSIILDILQQMLLWQKRLCSLECRTVQVHIILSAIMIRRLLRKMKS